MTITITAAELRLMLAQVTPHMSHDDTLPVINSVHLEARDGYLFAVASDRYTLAVARTAITSDTHWKNTFVPAEKIPALEAWLDSAFDTVTLAVIKADDAATLTITGKTGSMSIDYSNSEYRHFPDWRKLFRAQLDAKPQPVPLTGYTTKYLSRWEQAATVLQGWQYGPQGALVLMDEMGCFMGMQMPVRHQITRDDLLAKWQGSLTRLAYVDDQQYSLDTQWSDKDGDVWEYTGRDRYSAPLMRVVGIEDDDHTLADLIAQYGPISPLPTA